MVNNNFLMGKIFYQQKLTTKNHAICTNTVIFKFYKNVKDKKVLCKKIKVFVKIQLML